MFRGCLGCVSLAIECVLEIALFFAHSFCARSWLNMYLVIPEFAALGAKAKGSVISLLPSAGYVDAQRRFLGFFLNQLVSNLKLINIFVYPMT